MGAEADASWTSLMDPFTFAGQLLASYGWYLLGAAVGGAYVWNRWLRSTVDQWRQAREDAAYHKDPDTALARMEAVQRARERQQQLLAESSARAREAQREREERKRQENIERLRRYGAGGGGGGSRLGDGTDYMPLGGGASSSSYKPPKRSACARGGCGR